MKFLKVLRLFNKIKKDGIFKDYAIGGAVAVAYYAEIRNTIDLDLYFLVDDKGYSLLWQHLTEKGYKSEGHRIIIEGIPVDMFPVSIHPLYEEALKEAKKIRVSNIMIKVFLPEHLIALKLMSFRNKDRIDIYSLFEFTKIDMGKLNEIVKRYTDEKTPLRERLRKVLEESEQAR